MYSTRIVSTERKIANAYNGGASPLKPNIIPSSDGTCFLPKKKHDKSGVISVGHQTFSCSTAVSSHVNHSSRWYSFSARRAYRMLSEQTVR